ncbi:MAG: four helix bundle protein [Anaerolineae bacterium]|nr:four helix bundle protein [Anaerolineae bacterium]
MPTINRFEDINAWQAARLLVNLVYKFTKSGMFAEDQGLRDQIRRAAGSSMHNIAEGFDAGSNAEFIRFLRYALRSTSEVQSQLYTALDQQYVSEVEFQTIYDQAKNTKQLIHGFISYLVKNKNTHSSQVKEQLANYDLNTHDDKRGL